MFSSAVATSSGSAANVAGTSSGWTGARSRRGLEPLVDDALVRGMHVDEHEAVAVLRQDVDAVQLREREAERMRVVGGGTRRPRLRGVVASAEQACVEAGGLAGHRRARVRVRRRRLRGAPRQTTARRGVGVGIALRRERRHVRATRARVVRPPRPPAARRPSPPARARPRGGRTGGRRRSRESALRSSADAR